MTNSGGPTFVARIRYRDLEYLRDAELLVEVHKIKQELTILLDLDVAATGGFFSGECLIGMAKEQMIQLARLLADALGRSREAGRDWHLVGTVPYAWSDQGEPPGSGRGVSIMYRREQIRIVISPSPKSGIDEYVATMKPEVADELLNALTRGASSLESTADAF